MPPTGTKTPEPPKEVTAGEDVKYWQVLTTHPEGKELYAYAYDTGKKMKPEGFAGSNARRGEKLKMYSNSEQYEYYTRL